MAANKGAFPIFRFVFRALTSRGGKIVLVSLLAIPLVALGALRLSIVITVCRATALLHRIKQLKPRQSTYEDALHTAQEFGSKANVGETPCSSKDCSFGIHLA